MFPPEIMVDRYSPLHKKIVQVLKYDDHLKDNLIGSVLYFMKRSTLVFKLGYFKDTCHILPSEIVNYLF